MLVWRTIVFLEWTCNIVLTMEQQQSHPDEKIMKGEGESPGRDLDIGQVLAVHATPEEERRVLWKLDLV